MKSLTKSVLAAGALLVAMPQAAVAQDQYPLKGAEWIEVTGISLEDGGGLQYANWLASEWRKRMDYAVSQGWIESYGYAKAMSLKTYDLDVTGGFPPLVNKIGVATRNGKNAFFSFA